MNWKRFLAWCLLADRYPHVPWAGRSGHLVNYVPELLDPPVFGAED